MTHTVGTVKTVLTISHSRNFLTGSSLIQVDISVLLIYLVTSAASSLQV